MISSLKLTPISPARALLRKASQLRWLAAITLIFACGARANPPVADLFQIAETAAVSFNGAAYGMSVVDFDNDNAMDLAVTLAGKRVRLFHNDGGTQFTEIQAGRLTANDSFLFGTSWADVDNDGFQDVLVLRGYDPPGKAPCVLLLNKGGKEFVVDTNSVVAAQPSEYSPGLWGDFNRDGHLDIYLCVTGVSSGRIPVQDQYFLSNAQGVLLRQTEGVVTNWYLLAEYSNGGTATDLDGDGFLDAVILSSSGKPRWLRNRGDGQFSIERPFAFKGEPDTGGAPVAGDFNNDGRIDVLFATSRGAELFLQQPDGSFQPAKTGDLAAQRNILSVACADFDNDGWLDIFTSVSIQSGTAAANNDAVWRNNEGDGTFTKLASVAGADGGRTSGAVCADFDNNGFSDLYVSFEGMKSRLYFNRGNGNHWLTLKLKGTRSDRSALGAKIRLRSTRQGQENWQLRELNSGWGYAFQNDPRAQFGLGDQNKVEHLRIEWPSGLVQELHDLAADQILEIVEPALSLEIVKGPHPRRKVRIGADPGREVEIHVSSDLKTWQRLGHVFVSEDSQFVEFEDSERVDSQRFYRAVLSSSK